MSVGTTILVHPWYRQFYLRRGDAAWRSDRVSDAGHARGLEAIDGFVYVGTTMYGSPTEVTVRVLLGEPELDTPGDRSAEVLLGGAGDLSVLNWEPEDDPVATIPLPAGPLRLRSTWFGCETAAAHPHADIGGTEQSPERIVIDVWPA